MIAQHHAHVAARQAGKKAARATRLHCGKHLLAWAVEAAAEAVTASALADTFPFAQMTMRDRRVEARSFLARTFCAMADAFYARRASRPRDFMSACRNYAQ